MGRWQVMIFWICFGESYSLGLKIRAIIKDVKLGSTKLAGAVLCHIRSTKILSGQIISGKTSGSTQFFSPSRERRDLECHFCPGHGQGTWDTYIWVNYNISLTWIKAILGWFPLITMIPGFGRSEVVIIYPDIWINGICSSFPNGKWMIFFMGLSWAMEVSQ